MRAITFSRFGGPEVLEVSDLPVPEPGPDQVRIAVRAAGVNPYDWKVRSGAFGGELPQGTGGEVAGVVDKLGDGVGDVNVGDHVFGFARPGAAEYALSNAYAPLPETLDFTGAAGLPVAVETATRVLQEVPGKTIVINGAAGAVGQAAIQLARAKGIRVIGTASEANQEFLRELGAEPTTYGHGLAARLAEFGPIDGAIDAGGHGALDDLIKATGDDPTRVVTIVDFAGAQASGAHFSGGASPDKAAAAIREIGPLIDAGKFKLGVAQTFPLEQVAAAHALSETGHVRGKLILLV
ncbi:MAG: NADP-dependent oxidoreductase [Solirubrobacterales bacterium]|nr:NADP-dependent oxidoreductase [Solirubrobacterales bacterium]